MLHLVKVSAIVVQWLYSITTACLLVTQSLGPQMQTMLDGCTVCLVLAMPASPLCLPKKHTADFAGQAGQQVLVAAGHASRGTQLTDACMDEGIEMRTHSICHL